MFYIKKMVAPFFLPLPFCLILTSLGLLLLWFTKKQRTGKAVATLGVLAIGLLGLGPVSNTLLSYFETRYPPLLESTPGLKTPKPAFVVVLGGGHVSDPHVPITSQLSDATLSRLIEGIRIYRKNPGSKLVLSGSDIFDPVPESEKMAELAVALGVDMKDIILESASKDTKDQAICIKRIVENQPLVLVTSASHMPRSMALFKKWGMDPIPAPTRHLSRKGQAICPSDFFPGSGGIKKAERVFHEAMGIIWARIRGQI
jgi:uncharacterized SAM-binding protein YcdF (DUF218 family)